ncbi:MAG: aminoacyl-tRNA hydrolase [Pseudomonadota bacterium]
MASIRAIVGLGNPGPQYADTRHNAGFWFLERLADRRGVSFRAESKLDGELATHGVGDGRLFLFKPASFMNESGGPVGKFLRYYRIEPSEVLVAYDELDLEPGDVRLKQGGGHGGHNGLRDLFRHLPATDFARLRIGIGHPGHKDRVTGHVLGRPSVAENRAIDDAIDRALDQVPDVLSGHWNRAVKQLHTAA